MGGGGELGEGVEHAYLSAVDVAEEGRQFG